MAPRTHSRAKLSDQALSGKRTTPELPVGTVRPAPDASTTESETHNQSPPYQGGGETTLGGGGTRKGGRPSTAPVALHSFFGEPFQ